MKAVESETVSVVSDIRHKSWPLIISFAGLGDEFQFKNILSSLPVNVIYLRDLKHNWYLNGVPGVGENVEQISIYLKKIITNNAFTKVISMGASAGGFGALLYGCCVEVSCVMAFSPQTFMDRFNRILYWDRRWQDRRKEIYNGNNMSRDYLDLKPYVAKFKGSIKIYFDSSHRLDRIHASHISSNKNVQYFKFKQGGHTLVKNLKESGMLIKYIEEALK